LRSSGGLRPAISGSTLGGRRPKTRRRDAGSRRKPGNSAHRSREDYARRDRAGGRRCRCRRFTRRAIQRTGRR
jgi:hypothetical protein